MADTLNIYGVTYTGVAGIKATDVNDNLLTFVRAAGTLNLTANGTFDCSQYEYVNVSIPTATGVSF